MTASEILEGRNAVVAGGSRGIGRAVSSALARAGAAVIVNGRHHQAVQETVEAIVATGGRARAMVGNVADFAFAGELIAAADGIDILINCAGIAEPAGSSILDLSPEDWSRLVGAHLTSVFNTCRHAAPIMKRRGGGAIVNTSSHAYSGVYGGTGYPAGKGGTNSLTLAMAAELREHRIRVNAICPGARTRLSSGAAYQAHIEGLHARGMLDDATRAASLAPSPPEYAAVLYLFLASDLASEVTGQIFSAAGGYVGLHADPSETMIGFRDEAQGPWPTEELAKHVAAALGRA
jgi:3-oxoacyl-[acyl-carrier protein] reductase